VCLHDVQNPSLQEANSSRKSKRRRNSQVHKPQVLRKLTLLLSNASPDAYQLMFCSIFALSWSFWFYLCIYVIGVIWNSSYIRLSFPHYPCTLFCSCRTLALLCLKDRTTVEVKWYIPLGGIGLLHLVGPRKRFG
jgi:hypothetical protein